MNASRRSRYVQTTGWPNQPLMQDDDAKLSRWFATRMDARWLLLYVVYQ
jgi:hypothetical protein